MSTVKAYIDQWPTRADLAAEIGVKVDAVHKWAQNGSIPAKYHLAVLTAASARGFASDPMALVLLHARQTDNHPRGQIVNRGCSVAVNSK